MKYGRTLISLTLLAGCGASSTQMLSSWRDPAATQFHFEKVVVIAATDNTVRRQEAEDRLSRLIPRSTPSYSFISTETLKDPPAARNLIRSAGYDGAVILRLVKMTQEEMSIPASPFDDYHWDAYDWDTMGVRVRQEAAIVESRVYSVKENKLLWKGQSKTLQPTSLGKLIPEVVQAAADRMRQDGLIPGK